MKPKNLKMKQLKFKPDKAKIDYILAKLSEKASSDCPAEEAGNPKVAKPHTEAKNHELASKQNEFEFLKKCWDCDKIQDKGICDECQAKRDLVEKKSFQVKALASPEIGILWAEKMLVDFGGIDSNGLLKYIVRNLRERAEKEVKK